MKPKVQVLRAVVAVIATRVLRVASVLALIAAVASFALIWALAYSFSNWWWLLLIVYIPLLLIGVALRIILRIIVKRLQPRHISTEERQAINAFSDKIQRLLESRGMGWPVLVGLSIKDLLFHRDLTTIKALIHDTTSLRRDFIDLEARFKD